MAFMWDRFPVDQGGGMGTQPVGPPVQGNPVPPPGGGWTLPPMEPLPPGDDTIRQGPKWREPDALRRSFIADAYQRHLGRQPGEDEYGHWMGNDDYYSGIGHSPEAMQRNQGVYQEPPRFYPTTPGGGRYNPMMPVGRGNLDVPGFDSVGAWERQANRNAPQLPLGGGMGAQMARMRTPDGRIVKVPQNRLQEALSRGGQEIR